MSLGIKVCIFALGMIGSTAVGVGYGLFGVEKTKGLATHSDDPNCTKNRRYCVTQDGKVHISFFGNYDE